MKKIVYISISILAIFSACENQDWEFPDFDYSTVYFAYQSPVRTITLGDDIYDNTLDNQHRCIIMATMGGVYENTKDIIIEVVVDNSLCDSLGMVNASGDTTLGLAMPSDYYTLPAEMQIVIPSGKFMGGIEVQLTDAFFADPRSIKNTFVIPLVMTSVTNADSILSGESELDNPDRRIAGDWITVPKDYVLYAIKYINPWHGYYLRRGIDNVTGNSGNTALDTTYIYHEKYVEWDEVCEAATRSMNEISLFLTTKEVGNIDLPFEIVATFDESNNCTLSNHPDIVSYTLSGNGAFVNDGDMWGDEERDVLYLNYTIDFGTTTHTVADTLVMRNRGVNFETFAPVVL